MKSESTKRASQPVFSLDAKGFRRKFDDKVWVRAQDYVGSFKECQAASREIRGNVIGSAGIYTIRLRRLGRRLECLCTCPAGEYMDCKHAAALGLSYIREPGCFRVLPTSGTTEGRALIALTKEARRTSLGSLLEGLRKRGIGRDLLTKSFGIQARDLTAAIRLKKQGRRRSFQHLLKIACIHLLHAIHHEDNPGEH